MNSAGTRWVPVLLVATLADAAGAAVGLPVATPARQHVALLVLAPLPGLAAGCWRSTAGRWLAFDQPQLKSPAGARRAGRDLLLECRGAALESAGVYAFTDLRGEANAHALPRAGCSTLTGSLGVFIAADLCEVSILSSPWSACPPMDCIVRR